MKTLPGLTKCLAFATSAFSLMAIAECDRKHNVIFLPDYEHANQIILPGTEIEQKDVDQLREALRGNERFYLIQPFENGVAQTPIGTLPDIFACKEIAVEIADKAHSTNFSRWSRVVGQGCLSRCRLQTAHFSRHSRRSQDESDELVQRVKPILLKYRKE